MTQQPTWSELVPTTPAAMFDVWKLGTTSVEMWSTAMSTIMSRTQLWGTQSPLDPKMIAENQKMVSEKIAASWEMWFVMQKAWMNAMSGGKVVPWWTTGTQFIKPLHKRTTANSRRLS
ncbi:hypothetical protein Q4589_10995 [Cobetia marina]|uniref:hypothetical protein n=1 Tax=Cobetia marina TaxID=28258 RepID=UPI0026E1316F|nr:hypothetical protein [Cobetia marina]MDO6788117.1 hypothetical protein [Cobetia marina]